MAIFVGWRLSARLLQNRPLARRLPGLVALIDLFLLPGAVLVAGALLQLAADALALNEAQKPLRSSALLIAHLAAGWASARVIEVLLLDRANEDVSERIPKIVVGLIYAAAMVLGLVIFLWQRGYSFTGLWVSTGVAAGVLGFALQRTLGDLFSGIALGIERPFRLGDWVELKDGTVGQVIDINWRATHLRGWDNATLVIPNALMAGQAIKNLHDEKHLYAPWYFVKLPAEVEPRFATALLLEAALRCESVLKFPYPVARLADATTVPYAYMVWVHLRNYQTMFRAREELFREIHKSLQNAGIEAAPEVHELRTRRARVTSGEPPSIRLALKSLDVGGLLTEEELDQVVASSRYCHFDSGHRILAEGEASDAFYIISGGLVEASVTLHNGERKVTETLAPGDSFGITAMLTKDPSVLEFSAKSDVNLIRTDMECVRTIVNARPELAEHLAQVVKQRLDAAEAVVAASRRNVRRLSVRDIRQRIEGLVSRPGRAERRGAKR